MHIAGNRIRMNKYGGIDERKVHHIIEGRLVYSRIAAHFSSEAFSLRSIHKTITGQTNTEKNIPLCFEDKIVFTVAQYINVTIAYLPCHTHIYYLKIEELRVTRLNRKI